MTSRLSIRGERTKEGGLTAQYFILGGDCLSTDYTSDVALCHCRPTFSDVVGILGASTGTADFTLSVVRRICRWQWRSLYLARDYLVTWIVGLALGLS